MKLHNALFPVDDDQKRRLEAFGLGLIQLCNQYGIAVTITGFIVLDEDTEVMGLEYVPDDGVTATLIHAKRGNGCTCRRNEDGYIVQVDINCPIHHPPTEAGVN